MKKLNKPWAVAATLAALLFISMIYTTKYADLVDRQRARIAHLQQSSYRLEECKEALRLADILMDNNDLWDRDGSDAMSDYLNLRAGMDTTFYQGFHHNALQDSLALNYDE